ncbi:hypothetical protein QBC47DRAFT_318725 [Echria macrotheca]|uniref:NACHT domain-containing protein n=1 Tax=Echria macrotheca TaxID=438768 RepID=A0AAJ0BKF4_9PEZI|nr:hypothetical protein QBC47DRAFT_318725 [Echria macrotheca]
MAESLAAFSSVVAVADVATAAIRAYNRFSRTVDFISYSEEFSDALQYMELVGNQQWKPLRHLVDEVWDDLDYLRVFALWEQEKMFPIRMAVAIFGRTILGQRGSRLENVIKRVEDRLGQLSLAMTQRQSGNREAFANEIRTLSKQRNLGGYDMAVVEALLAQYRNSQTTEEEANYFTSSVQLVNRLGLQPGGNSHTPADPAREAAVRQEADRGFLTLISFPAMGRRQNGIESASGSSHGQVFEESLGELWPGLSQWLAMGSGLYLIQGNEGSGKSTMMSHIYTHLETKPLLSEWAHPSPLVMAAFYLWRSGTRLERSEEGILRSLLHSVLSQLPQLMPVVFPKEWAALYAAASTYMAPATPGLGAWKVDELRSAFIRLLRQDRIPSKIFFLIDGLDEYIPEDNNRGPVVIIEFFRTEIGLSTHAKALVSSRPLDAFVNLGLEPQVKLDELNSGDIRTHVATILGGVRNFRLAKRADQASADALIEKLVQASRGIFLWAVFRVNTIREDLGRGKTLAIILAEIDSQQRPSLQDLYRTLWYKLDEDLQRRASQAALTMSAGTDVLQRMAGDGGGDVRLVDLALGLSDPLGFRPGIKPWPRCAVTIQLQCRRLAEELTSAWPGFLTTAASKHDGGEWNPSSVIEYCQRSVPEFFELESAMLQTAAKQPGLGDFSPYIALLKSAVQQLKFVPPTTPLRQLWAFATMALLAAHAADSRFPVRSVSSEVVRGYHVLLQELDKTMQLHHDRLQRDRNGKYLGTRIQDPNGIVSIDDHGRDSKRISQIHWSNFHFDPACSHQRGRHDSFISLAVQFGLRIYVAAQFEARPRSRKTMLRPKRGRPLLDYAMVHTPVAPYGLVKSELVKILLDLGASPNDKFEGKTLWERALQWQYSAFVETHADVVRAAGSTSEDARRVAEDRATTFKLLVEKGANVKASIVNSRRQTVSARRVMDESFTPWVRDEVREELLALFPAV